MQNNKDNLEIRFEKIKNHKPRAAKKLEEIGDILSGMYSIDQDRASEMWQYIVDLNVGENIDFAKFYIAQVFNKLIKKMDDVDSANLITMVPERVELLINNGYEGASIYPVLNSLISGFIKTNNTENCMYVIETVLQRFGDYTDDNPSKNIINSMLRTITDSCKDSNYTNSIKNLRNDLKELNNEEIISFFDVLCFKNDLPCQIDYDSVLENCVQYGFSNDFMDILCKVHTDSNIEYIKSMWEKYLLNNDKICFFPRIISKSFDSEKFINSPLEYFVNIAFSSNIILERYFAAYNEFVLPFYIPIIKSLIIKEDWQSIIKYLSSLLLSCYNPSVLEYTYWNLITLFTVPYLENKTNDTEHLRTSLSYQADNYIDFFDFTDDIINDNNIRKFMKSLNEVKNFASGCMAEEKYSKLLELLQEDVKSLFIKDETNQDDPLDIIKQYIYNRLDSNDSSIIYDARYFYAIEKDVKESIGLEKWMEQIENDDKLLTFYLKSIDSYMLMQILFDFVDKYEIDRVQSIFEKLIQMTPVLNSKSYWKVYNVLKELISHYTPNKYNPIVREEAVTRDIIDNLAYIKEFIFKSLPNIHPIERQMRIDIEGLFTLLDQTISPEIYINTILEDVDIYSLKTKPRGKGNKDYLLSYYNEISYSFNILSGLKRDDVILQILNLLKDNDVNLKPYGFDRLFLEGISEVTTLDQNINEYLELFECYFNHKKVSDYHMVDLFRMLEYSVSESTMTQFKNMLQNIRGKISDIEEEDA